VLSGGMNGRVTMGNAPASERRGRVSRGEPFDAYRPESNDELERPTTAGEEVPRAHNVCCIELNCIELNSDAVLLKRL
jgi:hypothetical protein